MKSFLDFYISYLSQRNDDDFDENISFSEVCSTGDLNKVEKAFFSFNYSRDEKCEGMYSACECGHTHIIEFLINEGLDNYNDGLSGACKGGHIDIINQMIGYGADDWYCGLQSACEGGHREIIDFILEKKPPSLNPGLFGACLYGKLDIVKYMIEKGADDIQWGINAACVEGHKQVVDFLIDKGPIDWNTLYKRVHENNWTDLIVRTVYRSSEIIEGRYDINEVVITKRKKQTIIVDIHVKLFDVNLLK